MSDYDLIREAAQDCLTWFDVQYPKGQSKRLPGVDGFMRFEALRRALGRIEAANRPGEAEAGGGRLAINPDPLSVVERRDNVTALTAIRGRSREDRLRVWLALGGTEADFPDAFTGELGLRAIAAEAREARTLAEAAQRVVDCAPGYTAEKGSIWQLDREMDALRAALASKPLYCRNGYARPARLATCGCHGCIARRALGAFRV